MKKLRLVTKSKFNIFFCLSLLFVFSNEVKAQFGYSSEIGFFVGSVGFQSDYGESKNLSADINSGFGFGLVHFINFAMDDRGYFNNISYFSDRIKLRTELSYSKSNFQYSGRWIEGKPSLGKQQLQAMSGNSAVTNIGMQLEFFPWSIRDFTENIGSFAPFITLGAQYSFYNTKVQSTMGPLGTPLTTFPKYLTATDDRPYGFSSESSSVFSAVTSLGTRYKLTPLSDLMVDLRVQYYFSDWVDGLKPNPNLYKENKANDWLVWFNVGYIYYLP